MELLVIIVGLALASGGRSSTPGAGLVEALRQCQVGFARQAAEQLAELWGHDRQGLAEWAEMWGADCLRDLTLKWCDPEAYRATKRRAWAQRQRDKYLALRYRRMLRRAEALSAAAMREPWPVLNRCGTRLLESAHRGRVLLQTGFPAWTVRHKLLPELGRRVEHITGLYSRPEMLQWRQRRAADMARPGPMEHDAAVALALRVYCPPKLLANPAVPMRIKYGSAIIGARLDRTGELAADCLAILLTGQVQAGLRARARVLSYRPNGHAVLPEQGPRWFTGCLPGATRRNPLPLGGGKQMGGPVQLELVWPDGWDIPPIDEAAIRAAHRRDYMRHILMAMGQPRQCTLFEAQNFVAVFTPPRKRTEAYLARQWVAQYPELYRGCQLTPEVGALRPAAELLKCAPIAWPPSSWPVTRGPARRTVPVEVPMLPMLEKLWAMATDKSRLARAEQAQEVLQALAAANKCGDRILGKRALAEAAWALLTLSDTPWGDPESEADPEGPAIPMTEEELSKNVGLHMVTEIASHTGCFRQSHTTQGGEQRSGSFQQGPWVAHISELPELTAGLTIHRLDPDTRLQMAGWYSRPMPKTKAKRRKMQSCLRRCCYGPGLYCRDGKFSTVYCQEHALELLGQGVKGEAVRK